MKLSGPKQSPSQPAAIHVTNIALPGLVQAGLGLTAKRLSRWHVIENACSGRSPKLFADDLSRRGAWTRTLSGGAAGGATGARQRPQLMLMLAVSGPMCASCRTQILLNAIFPCSCFKPSHL